jgi:hypothetical protein
MLTRAQSNDALHHYFRPVSAVTLNITHVQAQVEGYFVNIC